ncbi:hypothetical protein ACHAXT_012020 [Thalassiosira profunda]
MARRSKRLRPGAAAAEAPSFDLLALLDGDLGQQILSYASASDLCTLDAASQRCQGFTTEPWENITNARFGMKNGKEGWKLGTSFMRQPTFMHLVDDGDHGYGDFYPGTNRVASNGSIVVAVTDKPDANNSGRAYPDDENSMGIRDAFSLNYIRTVASPIENWEVAICGRIGSEIIVTSNPDEVCARRGNDVQILHYAGREISDPFHLIGCETHLLVGNVDDVEIFRVNTAQEAGERTDDPQLVSKCTVTTLDDIEDDEEILHMSWDETERRTFVVCTQSRICVLSFDETAGTASLIQTIQTADLSISLGNVALSDEYIVGASRQKKIYVWSRNAGNLLHRDLCDVAEEDQIDVLTIANEVEDRGLDRSISLALGLPFYCRGHILVSTSHLGCALCIWNVKKGQLLKRYNNSVEERHSQVLDDDAIHCGNDATDMTYLEGLNAFLCMDRCMNVWSFPCNERQSQMAKSIRRREQKIKPFWQGQSYGSEEEDDDQSELSPFVY